MVFPGLGIDPAKVAEMQKISQYIDGVIRIDYSAKTVALTLSSVNPEASDILPELLSQLGGALATQLQAFFAIKGEIIEVSKPK